MTQKELNRILTKVIGARNVYFQPPTDLKMKYPCIVYQQAPYDTQQADNHNYRISPVYTLTTISKSSDWEIPLKILRILPSCRQESSYKADGMYHNRFTITM